MKLYYSPNSPYARKCRVVAIEKGVLDRIDLINVNPMDSAPELLAVNPLGTVPALVTREGLHLCESPVICEYLDGLSSETPLYPEADRICVLAMAALADGIMDAAVACVLEGRRPPERQYQAWVDRKQAAILRAIDKLAAVDLSAAPLSIGTIALAVALAYVDFRLPQLGWRTKYPKLAVWVDAFSKRESMLKTQPV